MGRGAGLDHLPHPPGGHHRSGFLQDHPAGYSGRVCVPPALAGQGDAVPAKPLRPGAAGRAAGHFSGQSAHQGPLGGAGAAGAKTGAAPAGGRVLALSPRMCPGGLLRPPAPAAGATPPPKPGHNKKVPLRRKKPKRYFLYVWGFSGRWSARPAGPAPSSA